VTTPLDFLRRVMPWPGADAPGYVNIHWVSPKDGKWRGRPYRDPEAAIDQTQYLAGHPTVARDIYFCLTLQSQTGKVFNGITTAHRSAMTALSVKSLWLDVDIKDPPKGYASLGDAIDAVNDFCLQAGLPPPSILVASGGGLHVYWVFDRPLTIDEWKPLALGLKAEAQRLGLRADHTVTADPARVLRVPGTFNRKLKDNPRPVKILSWGQDYDVTPFGRLVAIGTPLVPQNTVAVTAPQIDLPDGFLPMAPAFSMLNPMADVLGEGCKRNSDLPLDPTNMILKCPHFREVFDTGGAHQPQGVWMLDVLATTWMDDSAMWAQAFSQGYNDFDQAKLDAMLLRKLDDKAAGKGWPSCQAFEGQGCTACKTCPLKGTIKSPLNLASRIQIEPPVSAPPPAMIPLAKNLHLPGGYFLNKEGIICEMMPDKDVNGQMTPQNPKALFYAKVTGMAWCSHGPNGLDLHFTYEDEQHTVDVTVPYAVLASDQGLIQCLTSQGVMPRAEKHLRPFMISWVAQINKAMKRQQATPFGWFHDDAGKRMGFVYDGTLFKPDGTSDAAPAPDRAFARDYTPRGELAPILRMMEINRDRNVPVLDALELASWASPLLWVTGQPFAAIWTHGGESGAGKSTAISTGMAVWSSPGRTRENGINTSRAGIEIKMSQLSNLPLVVDELSDMTMIDKVIPLFQMASEAQSGQMGRRNRTGASKLFWKCMMICGSNKDIHARQVQVNGGTDAQVQRVLVLEAQDTPSRYDTTEVGKVRELLDTNYGHLGVAYAQWLATHMDFIETRGTEIKNELNALLMPSHAERFWMASLISIVLAAECANIVLEQQMYDQKKVQAYLVEAFKANRTWVAKNVQKDGTETQAIEVLGRFLEAHTNNQLATDKMNMPGRGKPFKVEILNGVMPAPNVGKGNVVHIHWAVEPRLVRIHLPEFKNFIKTEFKNLATSGAVIAGLKKAMGAEVYDRIDMLAGTKLTISQLPVTVIQMPITPGCYLEPLFEKYAAIEQASFVSEQLTQQDAAKADLGDVVTAAVKQAQKDLATVISSEGQ
jgi:hypothetical protein